MATPTPAPDADAGPQHDPAPGGGVFEYVSDQERTYTPPGLPPQTAQRGDVCALDWTPTDGNWRPSKAKPTRLPDDHPDVAAAREAAAVAAKAPAVAPPIPSDTGAATAPEQSAAAPGKSE